MNDKVIERLLELIRYKDAEIAELQVANKLTSHTVNRTYMDVVQDRMNADDVRVYSQSGREL